MKPGEGTESEEDEALGFHDYITRTYVDWENLQLPYINAEQYMRSEVRELQMGMFRQFWDPTKKDYKWWFVLKAS